MTEYQDKQATREMGTSEWSFVGHPYEEGIEDESWRVYQTESGELFAVDTQSDRMSFEVYENEGEFLVY